MFKFIGFWFVGKLGGMNENTGSLTLPSANLTPQVLCNKVYKVANVLFVPASTENSYYFAAKSVATDSDLLISIKVSDGKANVKVNCDKMVIGSMLLKDLKDSLLKV